MSCGAVAVSATSAGRVVVPTMKQAAARLWAATRRWEAGTATILDDVLLKE